MFQTVAWGAVNSKFEQSAPGKPWKAGRVMGKKEKAKSKYIKNIFWIF